MKVNKQYIIVNTSKQPIQNFANIFGFQNILKYQLAVSIIYKIKIIQSIFKTNSPLVNTLVG